MTVVALLASKAPSFKTTLARARAARNEVDALVDAIPLALLILDRELRVARVSHHYCEAFRVQPDDALGCSIYALGVGQWSAGEVRALLDGALRGDRSGHASVESDFPGLGTRTMRVHARSLAHPPAEPWILFAVEDVTELRRGEREALTLGPGERAQADQDAKLDEFLGRLEHQLRGPLASIANWLHLLTTNPLDIALQEQGLAAIGQALKAQTKLLDDLRAAGKK